MNAMMAMMIDSRDMCVSFSWGIFRSWLSCSFVVFGSRISSILSSSS